MSKAGLVKAGRSWCATAYAAVGQVLHRHRGADGAADGRSILCSRDVPPTIGGYRIHHEIGRGAMGAVYLGSDPETGGRVAIKTLDLSRPGGSGDPDALKARFLREAATVGLLAHPVIVVIYGAGEEGGLAYLAMEFIGGRNLAAWTRADSLLPLPVTLSVGARVADALDYAHRNQVVHRDIKPANIMYDPVADLVKVTDFGIASLAAAGGGEGKVLLGTPAYMPPEQLAGGAVDGRADLYALGVTLYELTTGQLPFVGDSVAELMYKIANEEAPAITAVDPALPERLAAIVGRCLAKDPGRRYRQGAELARDLRGLAK